MNLKDSTVLTGVQGAEMREQEGAGLREARVQIGKTTGTVRRRSGIS